jgi:hypothetical protein
MMAPVRGHFYSGQERPGAGRGAVEAGGAAWPRAVPADFDAAWRSLAPPEPLAAVAALERARLPWVRRAAEVLAQALRIPAAEAARLAAPGAAPEPPAPGGERRRPARDRTPRPEVVLAPWRLLPDRLDGVLSRCFAAGRPVLLLGDGLLPELAQALAEELTSAGLAAGALALLHAPDAAVLAAAAERGSRPLEPATAPRGVLAVAVHDELRAAARHAARAAFAAAPALGGCRPGALGRVRCDERVFSEFSAALLAELDAPGGTWTPAPLDREAPAALRNAVALGLEEGAAPIAGCDGSWRPSVLTNVDPQSRVVRLGDAVPLLLLERLSAPEAAGSAPGALG